MSPHGQHQEVLRLLLILGPLREGGASGVMPPNPAHGSVPALGLRPELAVSPLGGGRAASSGLRISRQASSSRENCLQHSPLLSVTPSDSPGLLGKHFSFTHSFHKDC